MKNVVYRLFGLVAISFCVCLAQAEGVWTLVTDASTLQTGDKVIIVSSVAERALGTTQNTNNRNAVPITKNNDNTCTIDEKTQQFTLKEGKSDGTYAFYTGDGYLYAASSKAGENYLKTESTLSNNSSWSISITIEGIATIVAQGKNTNNRLKHNSESYIFSCYSSSSNQKEVSLYKYSEVQSQPTTIQINNNGQITRHDSYIGASYSLPTEASEVGELEFVGWSKEPIVAGAAVANDAILSPGTSVVIIEEDMTFYAVYAKPVESGESAYIKVETEQEDWSGTYLIVSEENKLAFNGSLNENELFATDKPNATTDIMISDNKIEIAETTDSYAFVIEKYNEGYSIKSASGCYIGFDLAKIVGTVGKIFEFKIAYSASSSPIRTESTFLYYDEKNAQFAVTSNIHTPIQLYKRSETTKSYAFYTTSLSTEVAINKYGYSTWYAGMPVAVPEGMKAYYCIVDGNTAVLNDMGTVIPANTGAVLYAEEAIGTGRNYAMSYTNESITTDITKNLLIGYVQDTEVNNGKAHYALNVKDNVVGFYVPKTTEEGTTPSATSTFTAKAGKAYLELEPTASAVSLVIRRNSDTSIDAATVIPENIIYDLTGRRVITPSKGIYIVNGRKITM